MSIFLGDNAPSKIFVGDNQVSSVRVGDTQIRPAGWQPGANTIAYYPLETDADDHKGSYNGTISGTALTYSQVGGASINSAFFASTKMTTSLNTQVNTISLWAYKPSSSSDPSINDRKALVGNRANNNGTGMAVQLLNLDLSGGHILIKNDNGNSNYATGKLTDQWFHICVTSDGSNSIVYLNGTNIITQPGTQTPTTGLWLGTAARDNLNSYYNWRGNISNVIAESVVRTAQEVSDYYNQTKANYGL